MKMRDKPRSAPPPSEAPDTFVETALKLSGKSADEARRTGAVDRADDQVEALYDAKYQTTGSPIHRAVWDRDLPVGEFQSVDVNVPEDTRRVMDASLDVVRAHKKAGTLLDEQGKIAEDVLGELGRAGYWGLLIDREYGGSGASFTSFASFLTRMATVDPTVAGLASVHGCIGAVDPLLAFGTEAQKKRFLPLLASGERLSAFALTEPGAGSDLTALRTTARLDGDRYLVNGEKLFITNTKCGRTIGLVCLIGGQPSVLMVDLPDREDEHFQLVRYGLHALKHTHNQGMRFNDFAVPAENLLQPAAGDGLTIAYHGLNRGRVSLCANAAGTMRLMLAGMLPWADFRHTYGQAIAKRELVRRRIGEMAGLIVACDALTLWGGHLLDEGYRGEMECIIAKIFGSEAQKEAAIELCMKTHGGRAFLHGHLFGDNVHEFLAPCIYEGEGEMLGMAFFKSLVKQHGSRYFEPVGRGLVAHGLKTLNPANPVHAWKLRHALLPYARWQIVQRLAGAKRAAIPGRPGPLHEHARFAARALQDARFAIDGLMRRHELRLPDRQCAIAELSARVQKAVVMLVTALYGSRRDDAVVAQAAEVACRRLQRELTGERPAGRDFKRITELGETIAEKGFPSLSEVEADDILMPY